MQGIGIDPLVNEQELSIFDVDPWQLVGWLVLGLALLGLIAGLVVGVLWLIRRSRRGQPVQTST
jgi:hypothetical protein